MEIPRPEEFTNNDLNREQCLKVTLFSLEKG